MGQKVTFYNEISIQKPAGDNIKVPGNSSSLSSNGIYFSPANDILQDQPPHIVQGQYIYTLGSRVINSTPEKPEERSIVSVINENNTIEFKTKTDNNSLFVSDIESNQFDKTITIKKSAIDLSNITTPLKNIFDGLKSTDSSIIVNDTTIRLYWDDEEGLILADSTLQSNNILIINEYKTNTNLKQPSDNIIKIFAYTALSVSLPTKYSKYLTVENLTTLEPGYKYGKVIKLLKPWSDNYDNTYTFSGFNISAEKTDTYTSANQTNYSFKLSKIISPFEFNKSNNKFDVSNSPFSLSGVTTGAKGEVNYEYESSYNVRVGSGYCELSNVNKQISVDDAHYISDNSYVKINVTDNTQEDDIYYRTNKTYTLVLTGAKQWELSFDCNGGPASYNVKKNAYYNKGFTFPANPTREGYIFNGWFKTKTGGTKVNSITAGASGYTWTNYSTTLYAQWTQSVKYYWYVGNGDEIAKNDPAAGDIDWTKAQQITSFESLGYSANGTKITMNKTGENNVFILCPKSWSNKWQFWNVDNTIDLTTGFAEVSELLGISSFTKDGVEYDLWMFEMYAGNIAHMRSK